MGLTKEDFDFENQIINISKTWDYKAARGGFKSTKNKSSIRKVQLDWKLCMQFNTLLRDFPNGTPIFVKKRVFNSTVNNRLKQYCEELAIPIISIHGLRHTHASMLLFAGSFNRKCSQEIRSRRYDNNSTNILAYYSRIGE